MVMATAAAADSEMVEDPLPHRSLHVNGVQVPVVRLDSDNALLVSMLLMAVSVKGVLPRKGTTMPVVELLHAEMQLATVHVSNTHAYRLVTWDLP